MSVKSNIFGCFICYQPFISGVSNEQKKLAKTEGDLFSSYIHGEHGLDRKWNHLDFEYYGKDLKLVLFSFYIKPLPEMIAYLKEIERFHPKDKSVDMRLIITDENFFNHGAEGRILFLKDSVIQRLDLLAKLVRRRKMDTNMELLIADVKKVLES